MVVVVVVVVGAGVVVVGAGVVVVVVGAGDACSFGQKAEACEFPVGNEEGFGNFVKVPELFLYIVMYGGSA